MFVKSSEFYCGICYKWTTQTEKNTSLVFCDTVMVPQQYFTRLVLHIIEDWTCSQTNRIWKVEINTEIKGWEDFEHETAVNRAVVLHTVPRSMIPRTNTVAQQDGATVLVRNTAPHSNVLVYGTTTSILSNCSFSSITLELADHLHWSKLLYVCSYGPFCQLAVRFFDSTADVFYPTRSAVLILHVEKW